MKYIQIDLMGKVTAGKTTIYNQFAGDTYLRDGGNLTDDWRTYYARCWVLPNRYAHSMVFLSDPKFDMRWQDLNMGFMRKMFQPTNILFIVSDSTERDVENIKRYWDLLENIKRGLITFVLANKQDLPGAIPEIEIRERLNNQDVFGIQATDPQLKPRLTEIIEMAVHRYLLMLAKRGERLGLI
jgi:GTPase SAR1 family protein